MSAESEDFSPRAAVSVTGHDEAEAILREGLASGKLAHGWMITGPRGIGKATLAYRFARRLLAGEEAGAEHPVFHRMLAGSHTDLLVVEPAFDAKKGEYAREIAVDQARQIPEFMSLTPGEGQWRVVIVDPADALNTHSANALLKILEEPPPHSILMLITHNPGNLLPTIRSRCRQLRLKPLGQDGFFNIMQSLGIEDDDLPALAELSDFSPGLALSLREQGALALYDGLLAVLQSAPHLDPAMVAKLADSFTFGKGHAGGALFARLMLRLIGQSAKRASGLATRPLSSREEEAAAALALLHPPADWAGRWQQAAEQFSLAERLHLDYKQLIIAFLHALSAPEGLALGNA